VNWNKDFYGTAYLSVKALNRCGEGEWSDTLLINIFPAFSNTEYVSVCSGDSLLIADNWIKESSIYYNSLQTINGCDSVNITNLTVNPVYESTVDISICDGESYFAEGTEQYEPGTYIDYLTSIHGCDSVIVTNLSVNTLPDIYLGPDTTVNSSIILDAGFGFESYLWSTGEASQTIQVDSTSGSDAQIIYVTVFDSNNCMNSDTIIVTVDPTTQIIDLNENHNFRLYPNPSQGTLYIESDHPDRNTAIEIYSTKGILLLSKEFNNNQSMTICRLINDTYVSKQLKTPT